MAQINPIPPEAFDSEGRLIPQFLFANAINHAQFVVQHAQEVFSLNNILPLTDDQSGLITRLLFDAQVLAAHNCAMLARDGIDISSFCEVSKPKMDAFINEVFGKNVKIIQSTKPTTNTDEQE
jgi:hypothetical protein